MLNKHRYLRYWYCLISSLDTNFIVELIVLGIRRWNNNIEISYLEINNKNDKNISMQNIFMHNFFLKKYIIHVILKF